METTADERTRQEVEDLKQSWLKDPCWDIEDTEGFEAHRDELMQFRLQVSVERDARYKQRLQAQADQVGVDLESMERINACQTLSTDALERAKSLLTFYFRQTMSGFDFDNRSEVEEIVDSIVEAATYRCEASLILFMKKARPE